MPVEIIVEAEIEIDALHFAVGDEIGAGAQLIVHGQANRVAQRFLAVVGAEQVRVRRQRLRRTWRTSRERTSCR